jgi:hypothetical protein
MRRTFVFFLGTNMGFSTHFLWITSLMKPAFNSLDISFAMARRFLISEASHCLSHWLGARDYFQGMLGKFPGYTSHVRWLPCKDIPVLTEELDERAFLFGGQICPN